MHPNKYITFSFDDCEIYDRVLCDMFRRYGMKATFFLISDQLGFRCDFHRYGEDTVVERVAPEELKETYAGMEIASHTANHRCPVDDLENAVVKSAQYLSDLCGYKVEGMAYPGGQYTPEHVTELKRLGIQYARTVQVTHDFAVPREWLAWDPTCKYDDDHIMELADQFLEYQGEEPAVFHIYGHSYELTRKEKGCSFDDFERLLLKLSGREDIVYATNIEIVRRLKELR
ncbi:MAG: polysaccharide deacetylase family protein [Lachnospiraceae bacterium]|nr:polysaccharide deacetylase family protein [Lachnospiraceae bacterium]